MIKAAITPGTQPINVRIVVIRMEPQPLSMTASGGKITHNKTRQQLIANLLLLDLDTIYALFMKMLHLLADLSWNGLMGALYKGHRQTEEAGLTRSRRGKSGELAARDL